jgi:hypothetical protein
MLAGDIDQTLQGMSHVDLSQGQTAFTSVRDEGFD